MPGYRNSFVVFSATLLITLSIAWFHGHETVSLQSEYGLAENQVGNVARVGRSDWSPYEDIEDQKILRHLDNAPAWVRRDYGYHRSDDYSIPPAPEWVREDASASADDARKVDVGARQSQIARAEESALHWAGKEEDVSTSKTNEFLKRAKSDEKREWAKTLFTKHFLKANDILPQERHGASKDHRTKASLLSTGTTADANEKIVPSRTSESVTAASEERAKNEYPTSKSGPLLSQYQSAVEAAAAAEAARARAMEAAIDEQKQHDRVREAARAGELLAHVQHPARAIAAAPAADSASAARPPATDSEHISPSLASQQAPAQDRAGGEPAATTWVGLERDPDRRRRGGVSRADEERLTEENARLVKAQSSLLNLLAASEARCVASRRVRIGRKQISQQ